MRNTLFFASLCWLIVALPSHGSAMPGALNCIATDTLRPCPTGQANKPDDTHADFTPPTGLETNHIIADSTAAAEWQAATSAPRVAPLAQNLLPLLSTRLFGIEERVALDAGKDGLTLRCQAGNHPAGVILEDPERVLPDLGKVNLRVVAEHSGDFRFALYDPHRGEDQPPRILGALPQGAEYMPLPAPKPVHGPRYPLAFSLLCPDAGGEARLDRLELLPNLGTGRLDRSLSARAWHSGLWPNGRAGQGNT